ncbi:MAG: tetratricopeptide repeat protein [Patescibacteria group bacterium]
MQEYTQGSKKLAKLFANISRMMLIGLAGLVPLFFLSWTVEPLEVNKQTLLIFLAAIAMLAWLGMMVVEKRLYFKKSSVFVVVAVLLISVALSAAFSLAPFTSWVGQAKQEYTSFLTFLGLALIFLIGSHTLSRTKTQRALWSVSLLASAFIGIVAVLNQFGLSIFETNLIGSPSALGFYLVSMAVLGCGLWLVANPRMSKRVLPKGWFGSLVKFAIIATVISALLVTLALDFWALWAAMLIGLGIIFIFTILRAQEFPQTSRFFLPMILFVCAILFLFLPSISISRYPTEVSLSSSSSFSIVKATLQETSWLFGSGPGTFVMDYTKHQPEIINDSLLWDERFDRAGSYFLTLLPTIGVVGTLLFLTLMLLVAGTALWHLITKKADDEWKMTFVSFAAWSVLAFGVFVYSSNMTLSFMFWLLSAIIVSQAGPATKKIAFSQSPRYGLLTAFLFVLVSIGLLTSMFVTGSRYAAEIAFARGVASDKSGSGVDSIIEGLDRAASMNKLSDLYYRNLGNALLVKTAELIQEPDVSPSDIQMYIEASVTAAERATMLSPDYVVNWALLGDVYREVSPLVDGADELSISAYDRAVQLSPQNPKYRVMLGRAFLIYADHLNEYLTSDDEEFASRAKTEREAALASAETVLEEAIALKGDYAPAHYYLASVYERQGNLTEAVSRMESLRSAYQSDIGISFQLGLLYLRQGKSDLAKAELERALEIAPNYSNAMWYLAAVYEEDGDAEKALELLREVKVLNPVNQLVDQRIERIEAGIAEALLPEPLEGDQITDTPQEEALTQ